MGKKGRGRGGGGQQCGMCCILLDRLGVHKKKVLQDYTREDVVFFLDATTFGCIQWVVMLTSFPLLKLSLNEILSASCNVPRINKINVKEGGPIEFNSGEANDTLMQTFLHCKQLHIQK